MPFINVKYSGDINAEQEVGIKAALGEAMSVIGKTESWLMVGFEPNCSLYFRGSKSEKIAFVEVSVFGSASRSAFEQFTAVICKALGDALGVPADMVYVKYSPTENWGWNGGNF